MGHGLWAEVVQTVQVVEVVETANSLIGQLVKSSNN
jgi:hypothetical protein